MLGKISSLKKGWLLFWVEATFLIGVAVVLLVLLNYFNIISLSRYVPILDFLPRQQNEILSSPQESGVSISVDSQRNGYKVVMNSEPALHAFFQRLGVKERIASEANSGQVEHVVIVLSGDPLLQHAYSFVDGGNTRQFTYQFNVIDDIAWIFLYIPDKELENSTASQFFSRALIYAISPHSESDNDTLLPAGSDIDGLFTIQATGQNEGSQAVPFQNNRNAIPAPSSGVNR